MHYSLTRCKNTTAGTFGVPDSLRSPPGGATGRDLCVHAAVRGHAVPVGLVDVGVAARHVLVKARHGDVLRRVGVRQNVLATVA